MEGTEFISRSPYETIQIGEKIGQTLSPGDLVLITGELGSGKTQLVKGIARGLGVLDWMYVLSPSFTLVNIYEGERFPLFHVDLYRISEKEVADLFLEEMLDEGAVVVEWADRTKWDNYAMKINIDVIGEAERRITVKVGEKGKRLSKLQ